MRHLSGTSTLLDQVPLPVTEIEARFPLTEHLWLTASTACRVSACDTATLIRLGDPWAGLDDFHRTILDFISGIQEHETRTRWTEFQQSIVHDAAVVESVATRLAAAVERDRRQGSRCRCRSAGDGLPGRGANARHRGACSADKGGIGAPSTSLDPLGDLARASGFHVRTVTLPEVGGAVAAASRCSAS